MPIESTGLQSIATTQPLDEILIVDDTAADRLAVAAVLEPLGVRVVTADSGEAALRLLPDHDFRLLIVDVFMPTMGGFDLARRVRAAEHSRQIPIIFITASEREDRRVLAAYELGAVDFLFKPLVPQVLRAKASVFIDLARHAERVREHERGEHERQLEMQRKAWREESLQHGMDHLAEVNRRKDHFLAILGHELRNPLTPLVASLELLRHKIAQTPDLDPMFERTREIMSRHVQHLTRLAEDLVDVARINSGKVELRKEPSSVQELITLAVSSSRPLMETKGQTLELQLPTEPLLVEVDRVRLVQVVTNLLNNASRYSPPKATIKVSCGRVSNHVELSVEDNGQGIPQTLLPRVFDPFVQGNEHPTKGLGLGLAIVKRLTELHEGAVSAHSEGEGRGSRFTVRLPSNAKGDDGGRQVELVAADPRA